MRVMLTAWLARREGSPRNREHLSLQVVPVCICASNPLSVLRTQELSSRLQFRCRLVSYVWSLRSDGSVIRFSCISSHVRTTFAIVKEQNPQETPSVLQQLENKTSSFKLTFRYWLANIFVKWNFNVLISTALCYYTG